ncbi:MAG TPA: ABC transporter ATP-binding protein, partial [Verrucomicrobiae bacterium]|nr:ABC transporter ATP-binding protein [Verrucomicrobiae bacterium]
MTEPIIRTVDMSINFGGHTAVNCVSLDIVPKTFCSIIGPNGAGKTTFFNLLSGQLMPTAGKIFFKGQDITNLPPHLRTRSGIGRNFQITNVFPNLSVLENVRLAVQAKEGVHYQILRHYRKFDRFIDKAMDLLETVHLGGKFEQLASSLAHGDKRKLELAIILALEPEVMLLDEPTAGMSVEEVPVILELLARLKAEGNRTILLVEHKIEMVMSLSDTVVVFANGKLLAQEDPQRIMANEQV